MESPGAAEIISRRLRIELQEIAPLIWRRIVVSGQWTFAALHNCLQSVANARLVSSTRKGST